MSWRYEAGDALTLVVLAALWGSSFLFIRVAVPSFGPLALVAARVLLGAPVWWPRVDARNSRNSRNSPASRESRRHWRP